MLDLLIVIAIVIPGWYAYKRSVVHGLVAINHVSTFTFGFLLYWITPILVGVFGSHFASRLSEIYVALFDKRILLGYLTACIALYICFAIGDSLAARLFREQVGVAPRIPRLALSMVTAAGCLLALYVGYTLRAELLLPYGTGITFKTARGTLTSCVVLLGVVSLMYVLDRPELSWRQRLVNRYSVPFLVGCALFLWMGTRLYVVSFFLMFAVYQSNFQKRLKVRTVVGVSIIGIIALAAIGMWRSHVDASQAAVSVVQEPVLTSLSLIYHLRRHGITWLNSPVYLASDFLNLIPTPILPDKASLLKKPPVYNPLGGLHSFVSFDLNFGVFGSAIFLFLLPIALWYLKSRSSGTVFAVSYVMCTGWLAFTFFRDPFQISLVKAMLQGAVLMPIAVAAFGQLLAAACSRGRPVSDVPEIRPQAI